MKRLGVVLLVAASLAPVVPAGAVGTKKLFAWAGFRLHPRMGISAAGFRGRLAHHLPAGTYVVHVSDQGYHFHLLGPGVNKTDYGPAGYVNWTVKLRPGDYNYSTDFARFGKATLIVD